MIDPTEAAIAEPNTGVSLAPAPHEAGWYVYGITRRVPGLDTLASAGAAPHGVVKASRLLGSDRDRVQLLECGSLAVVVRRVPLADFTVEALQTRLSDPTGLESIVQTHNAVIGAIHEERPILPARLGAVYARLEDLTAATDQSQDALLAQLDRLDGCDEWAVHLYVDQQIVRDRVRAELASDPLQQELAGARPGRAYFLRRKMDDALASRIALITEEVALSAYQRLARLATCAEAGPPVRPSGDARGEVEVLRGALLVRRERSEDLVAQVRAIATEDRGVRCTYSGPWPPYSFASITEGTGDDQHDA